MDEIQRKRQMGAIHSQYRAMLSNGTLQQLHADPGEGIHIWATQVLGRVVSTLTACSDFELNALRDRLNGKDPKLMERVLWEFKRVGIQHPDNWIAYVAKGPQFARWRGLTVDQLPMNQLYRLLKMLETRRSRPGFEWMEKRENPGSDWISKTDNFIGG